MFSNAVRDIPSWLFVHARVVEQVNSTRRLMLATSCVTYKTLPRQTK